MVMLATFQTDSCRVKPLLNNPYSHFQSRGHKGQDGEHFLLFLQPTNEQKI